jgi:transposase
MSHIDQLESHKDMVEQDILRLAAPYERELELIHTVPGFGKNTFTAITILSEIGADMSVFPSAKHLVSWAGCCPRNDQSAQKIKSTRISRAGTCIKPLLVQVANALIKSKHHPEFSERYRRLKARRGHKKAIIATCRMLLTAIWNVLSKAEPYSPVGYLSDHQVTEVRRLTQKQALNLLKSRWYVITDEESA